MEYIEQSREQYKGFELVIELYSLDPNNPLRMHRRCKILKDGESIGIDKTKKSAKDLIDHGCFKT